MRISKYKKLFSIEYGDNFHVTIYFLGIRLRGRWLYNLIFGNPLKTNCSIFNLDELIKKKTLFYHPTGICIAEEAEIGNCCRIYQNVTIGRKGEGFPKIGNYVQIMAGAVIIGDITIGDYSIIGANAVVTKDVVPKTVVAGVPAKFIRNVTDEEIKKIKG
ncbi:serine acetyltransferase [bacterium]|nr:serine acetyltransferase [bacterium]